MVEAEVSQTGSHSFLGVDSICLGFPVLTGIVSDRILLSNLGMLSKGRQGIVSRRLRQM